MNKYEAMRKLYPNIITIRDDTAYDINGNEVSYDAALVEAEVNANAYKHQRVSEYPPIGDQLDALFHAGVFPTDMAEKIQAVKNKYSKGSV
jgi:hypothetical protein